MERSKNCEQGHTSSSVSSFRMSQEMASEERASEELALNIPSGTGSKKSSQYQHRSPQRPSFRAPQEPFTAKDFVYGHILGLGSYSKVVKATKKDTGLTYALKIMDKLHIVKENKTVYVKLERIILDQLDHPGVIRLFFTFQDIHYLYMGLECCDGGELFDQIQRKKRLSLDEARFYAAELVEVMEYLHGQGLIHRDLKPENLLLTKDGHLKVADFGSAKVLRPFCSDLIQNLPDDKSCTFVGTAEYVSPEVLNSQPITTGVDLWALGCILYQMLVGRPPFKCASEYLTFQKVMARDFKIPDYVAPEAKDLINCLLDLNPNKRVGAGPDGYILLKAHPFFHGIEWRQLRQLPAPPIVPLSATDSLDDESVVGDDSALDSDWDFAHIGGNDAKDITGNISNQESCIQKATNVDSMQIGLGANVLQKLNDLSVNEQHHSLTEKTGCEERIKSQSDLVEPSRGAITTANSSSIKNLVSRKEGNIPSDKSPVWLKFLFPNEKIRMMSVVKKYQKISFKRRILILTDKQRLIYIDAKKMVQKGEIQWSWNANEMFVRPENETNFIIWTPKRTYAFEDLRGLAWQWKDAIELAQKQLGV